MGCRALGGLWLTALLLNAPAPAQQGTEVERPPGLVVVLQKPSSEGVYTLGVYQRRPDPQLAGLWSVKIWEQVDERVAVASERVGCNPGSALRITRQGSRLEMRLLNPGGLITPANRSDHLIWWSVCAPDLAGRDPAELSAEARRRGFDGSQRERRELLPAAP